MTSPTGGQNINLAALWIPVMPETSHMGEEMRKTGSEAKKAFEEGFNSSGSSPEQLGSTYMGKFRESITKGFGELEIPFGGSKVAEWFDKFGGSVDEKVVNKLKGQATEALRAYAAEHDKLVEAQNRATEAETKLGQARDAGFNKASIMIPLMQQQTQAHAALADQVTRTTAAHDQLNTATSKLTEEQNKSALSGQALAGVMGGLVVVGAGLALKAVEEFADMVKEGFEAAIDITKELAEQTIELGEKYEDIGVGVREFSSSSGEAFEELEGRARKVFGSLDVAGENTGQTMAQLTSILGEAIPDSLVKHVEDLQGRFANLKAQDVAGIFYAFKTPAEETDAALASLLQSARGAGQGVGDLVSMMKGDAAETLHQAGLNAQQAGAFIADIMKIGPGGRTVLSGLNSAMKDFAKEGLSFGDGMKLAGERLKELGDTADGQELAEKLFGTRKWATAMAAAQDYVDVVSKGPEAFDANAASVDEFITQTETLENKWEEVKHKIEEALMPAGLGAVDLVDTMIKGVKTSFDQHLPEIRTEVKKLGDSFLDNLPTIKDFVSGSIALMGPLFDFLKEGSLVFAGTLQGLVEIYADVTGNTELQAKLEKLAAAEKKFGDIDFTKLADKTSDQIDKIGIPTDDIKKKFDAMWDSARGEGADQQSPGEPIPDMTPSFNTNGPHGYTPGAAPAPGSAAGATPGSAPPPSGSPAPAAGTAPTSGPQGEGHHNADWDAVAQKESSGVWNQILSTGIALGGGLQIKDDTWYQYGGLAFGQHPYQATKEQQEMIAERILNGWGTVAGQGPSAWNGVGPQSTYVERKAKGGKAGNGDGLGRLITQGSGNGDDVAALLKRGEYVWDTETMDKFGWLVTALHQGTMGFGQGGDVGGVSQVIWSDLEDPTVQAAGGDAGIGALYGKLANGGPGSPYSDETNPGGEGFSGHHGHVHTTFNEDPFTGAPYGIADQNTTLGDYSAFPPWVKQLADMYGLDPKTYVGHQVWNGFNHGIDWYPRGKQDMSGKSYNHADNEALSNFANAAIAVGTGQMQGFTGGLGVSPLGYGTGGPGSTPGGKNGGLYPGLPGQYGGNGVYGGQTTDQAFAAAQAVQEAQDQQADKNHAVDVAQRRVDDLTAKLNAPPAPGNVGLLTGLPLTDPKTQAAEAQKHKELEEQLDDATYNLTKARREAGEQTAKVDEAERKQQESALKKPGTTAGGNKDAQALGSGLLAGISQELGLGDVFGKSPLDWGIVKLGEGLFNYANNLGDAIFGKTNSGGMLGGSPGGSQGLGAGMATGLLGSLGLKLPSMAISAAGNVIPGAPPGSPASGAGFGTPPGPQVVNNDNSISVQAGVTDKTILGPVQNMQNSTNSAAFQYQGGLPAQ